MLLSPFPLDRRLGEDRLAVSEDRDPPGLSLPQESVEVTAEVALELVLIRRMRANRVQRGVEVDAQDVDGRRWRCLQNLRKLLGQAPQVVLDAHLGWIRLCLSACLPPRRTNGRIPCSEQKIAQFRTHYLTKELAYVSTQPSGQFDTFLSNHFSVHYNLA